MRDVRRIARGMVVACGLVLVAGCRNADPESFYITGDFLAAREHYNAVACAKQSGDAARRCSERAAQIDDALIGAAQYLGRRANERVRNGKQIQYNQYGEAVRSLELALKILPPDHPSRADFSAGIQRIRETQTALATELDEQLKKLKAMLETSTYDPEVWTEIRLTFERVRILVLAVGKNDDRPRELARELMTKFRGHGQYELARIASDLAESIDGAVPVHAAHTDNELVTMGVIDYMAQQQEAARQAKIAALAKEAAAAFAAKKQMVAAGKARAALELGPTGRTARQMRAILEQTEGATGQVERARVARRVVAETSADIAPVPLAKPLSSPFEEEDAQLAAQPVKVEEQPTDHRPADQRLKDILRQYEKKQLYEAVSGLEQLARESLRAPERRKVSELRRLWAPDRKRVLVEIVDKADRLYVLMDEQSLGEYQRALKLSPDGDTAKHINERIQTLTRILSY